RESHHSKLTIHPGGNKMYRDLKRAFYWEGMKRAVDEFVSKCMNCKLIKTEQKKRSGLLHPLEVPQWK
ncbi:integrase zinc binding domain-containing protein, partial [Pseudomonas aeruginosa]|uniref:integrase zinc binding domain-containing protein n=1 Tax=Pseudomonas aeruginosa TaxID=287 RepID=UPI0027D39954